MLRTLKLGKLGKINICLAVELKRLTTRQLKKSATASSRIFKGSKQVRVLQRVETGTVCKGITSKWFRQVRFVRELQGVWTGTVCKSTSRGVDRYGL